jgi:hypothetical protein
MPSIIVCFVYASITFDTIFDMQVEGNNKKLLFCIHTKGNRIEYHQSKIEFVSLGLKTSAIREEMLWDWGVLCTWRDSVAHAIIISKISQQFRISTEERRLLWCD